MNSSSFLRADGTLAESRHAWWSGWLPPLSQVQQAIQLNFAATPDATPNVWAISMRQGLGLVVVAAIVAGFVPFLFNTVAAVRAGAPLPFVQLAEQMQSGEDAPPSQLGDAFATLAGLSPSLLPGWLAALLSTVGEWINWPLRWLAWWLIYGTATLLAAKAWGATTTLQRFLAVTSYAAVPMILIGLGPIPCLGILAQIAGIAWMIAVYVSGVRAVTGLDWGRTVVAVLLPAAIVSMASFIVALAVASTIVRMLF
jgi:hypothetical protein